MKLDDVKKFAFDASARRQYLAGKGVYDGWNDEKLIKMLFKDFFGYELNLDAPKTLCEKIQWLKLYNRNPQYTMMADKLRVKEYISKEIGSEYVIPLVGNDKGYRNFDEINFDELPDQFIIKCTHNSGGFSVCKNKAEFDKALEREKFERMLRQNYYSTNREWVYKDIEPRLIVEEYIPSLGHDDSVEYKATCFDGKVGFVTICQGPAHDDFEKRKNDHFTPEFKKLDWYVNYKPAEVTPKKPEQWDDIVALSEKLSKGIPYVRVDWYVVEGHLKFGEFTFYTWGGFMHFEPEEWDRKLGDMVKLPQKRV